MLSTIDHLMTESDKDQHYLRRNRSQADAEEDTNGRGARLRQWSVEMPGVVTVLDKANGETAILAKKQSIISAHYTSTTTTNLDPPKRTNSFDTEEDDDAEVDRHCLAAKRVCVVLSVIAFHAFLGSAMAHDAEQASGYCVATAIGWCYFLYWRYAHTFLAHRLLRPVAESSTGKCFRDVSGHLSIKIAVYSLIFCAIGAFAAYDTVGARHRLFGFVGIAAFVALLFLLSNKRSRINWRPVILGYTLQFLVALCVLRWPWGVARFSELSEIVARFLDFARVGSDFVYGFASSPPDICGMEPILIFRIFQVIIFFGAIVSLLFYYGIIQMVLRRTAWLMQKTLTTTATESLNACACTFLGQCEAPMLIRPYLERMTDSELHALLTTGFSCIAGASFSVYASYGVCPKYLLSSTLMGAPGALASSKLIYPETKKSESADIDDLDLSQCNESSPLEAISNGVTVGAHIVISAAANIVAFMAMLACLDAVLSHAVSMCGYEQVSMELLFGYMFFPFAYLIGVNQDYAETFRVAQLLGTKISINELIAYQHLGRLQELEKLTPRTSMIATYALCSFANLCSAGIQLGVLGTMAPRKKKTLARMMISALITGSVTCFITASLAGILIDDPVCDTVSLTGNGTCFNVAQAQSVLAAQL